MSPNSICVANVALSAAPAAPAATARCQASQRCRSAHPERSAQAASPADACPRCRGVWLDRGELDKLIELEKSAAEEVDEDFLAEIQGGAKHEKPDHQDKHDDKHGHSSEEYGKKKKKKGSFLADFLEM